MEPREIDWCQVISQEAAGGELLRIAGASSIQAQAHVSYTRSEAATIQRTIHARSGRSGYAPNLASSAAISETRPMPPSRTQGFAGLERQRVQTEGCRSGRLARRLPLNTPRCRRP